MSERYDLVLGQDLTCPEPVRRKYYRWMLVYLLFAGGVLIEGAFQIANRLRTLNEASFERDSLLKSFGGEVMPSQLLKEAIARGESKDSTVVALNSLAKPSIPLLPVLFEVHKSLPAGVVVRMFEMNAQEVELVLEFPKGRSVTPESYLAQWRSNEELNRYLNTVKLVDRDDGKDDGNQTWVTLTCSATVKSR